jgi:hypothetical protein
MEPRHPPQHQVTYPIPRMKDLLARDIERQKEAITMTAVANALVLTLCYQPTFP